VLVSSTLAVALVWLLVALTPVTTWLAGGLVRRDVPAPAAAVFVFSSRVQTDGEPTATALARLLRGVELIGEGYARRLILSEIAEPGGSYATYARLLLRRLGQETELLVVGPVRNTREEAVAVAGLCRARGFERILAVTSPSHSRRALGSLQAEGVEALSIPAVEVRFDLETLDRPEERLAAFGALVHERLGIWVYERRGWIGTRGRRAPTGRNAAPTSR
jgi:uncharacterized SAM-binding protein YcdF (DUF218 family)